MSADVLEELEWRGLVQDVSDREGLKKLAPGYSFYVGYDPSAPSLHFGNLVPMIVSIHLAHAGLKAIQLFGGATGAIGDPSGKNAERPLLSRETINQNIAKHSRKVAEIFEHAGAKVQFVNNYDWTEKLCVIDFLRDIGKYFTVNYMLAKDSVKARLGGEGLSFTEFSYMLLQANDFLELYQTHGCRLQIGGTEQWGNITAGLELIRRKIQGEAYALSLPLITDSQGRKFGKSEGGTVWLDAKATSPYRFHQFWLNVEDADVIRYLKIFTFHDRDTIADMQNLLKAAPEKRAAQHLLADSVCTLVHGEEAVQDARRSAEVLFGGSLEGLSSEKLEEIFSEVPSSTIGRAQLSQMKMAELFSVTGLVSSKGEARRLIEGGGAYLNNQRVGDPEAAPAGSCVRDSKLLVLRAGKKNYHLVRIG